MRSDEERESASGVILFICVYQRNQRRVVRAVAVGLSLPLSVPYINDSQQKVNTLPRTFPQLCTLVMLSLVFSGCSRPPANGGPPGADAPGFPVKISVVEEHMVPDFTDYLATLRSRNTTALQPQVEGAIGKIFVHSGQKVETGTPILE